MILIFEVAGCVEHIATELRVGINDTAEGFSCNEPSNKIDRYCSGATGYERSESPVLDRETLRRNPGELHHAGHSPESDHRKCSFRRGTLAHRPHQDRDARTHRRLQCRKEYSYRA